MDYLYYSNYCKHSAKLLQHLAKTGAINKLNCVCVDRRKRNPSTGQTIIVTETGTQHPLPISVNSVPAVLLVSDKYRVVVGQDIYGLFPDAGNSNNNAKDNSSGEPEGFLFSGPAIGESYSNFGAGGMLMELPPDNYKSNKMGDDVTMASLQEKRNADLADLKIPFLADVGSMPGNAAVRPNLYA